MDTNSEPINTTRGQGSFIIGLLISLVVLFIIPQFVPVVMIMVQPSSAHLFFTHPLATELTILGIALILNCILVVLIKNKPRLKRGLIWGYLFVLIIPLMVVYSYFHLVNGTKEARVMGSDALIQANLANVRPQAEILFDTAGNYDAVCGSNGIPQDATIARMVASVEQGRSGSVMCLHDGNPAKAWVMFAPLMSDPKTFVCVDSNGALTKVSAPLQSVSCGAVK